MGARFASRIILLAGVHALFFAALLRAQAPPLEPPRCLPLLPSPEFKAETGQQIYPPSISIEFEGMHDLPETDRIQLTSSIRTCFLQAISGYVGRGFSPSQAAAASITDLVRLFLQDRGYYKAEVTVGIGNTSNKLFRVYVHLDEGPQYHLKDILLRSSKPDIPLVFSRDQLRALIPLKDGEIFTTKAIRDGLAALRLAYSSRGYIDVTSQPLTEIDDDSRQISLTLEIDQELQYRIGTVEIYGLKPKLEKTLRSQFKPGDVFNPGAINEFYAHYKSALPPDASPKDVQTHRENQTVSLVFDFRPCPPSEKSPQY
jgi:outer membrane protein assembly factor BamA